MKKYLTVLFITVILLAVIGCGDDPCNLGAHLGIGENCGGSSCTLQNYNTSTGANAFPTPIYRVGKEGNNGATFTSTANAMAGAYSSLGATDKNLFNAKGLTEVHLHIGGKEYTWSGSGVLGLRATEDLGTDAVNALATSAGLPIAP